MTVDRGVLKSAYESLDEAHGLIKALTENHELPEEPDVALEIGQTLYVTNDLSDVTDNKEYADKEWKGRYFEVLSQKECV